MVDPWTRYQSDDTAWLGKPDREVEGPWVERKERFSETEIARQISGFANGHPPGGLIVIGSDKDGLRLGLGSDREKAYSGLSHIPVESTDWQHRFVPVGSTDEVLYIWVPFSGGRVVCKSDGTAFQRVGSSTIQLASAAVQELRYSRGESQFEQVPAAVYASDLIDPEIARELIEGIVDKNGLRLPLTIDDALANKELVVRRGEQLHLTMGGLLAVGRKPTTLIPEARIHFQRFEGTVEEFGADRNVTKERWFDGPTKQMLLEAEAFIATLMREFDYLGPNGQFVTEPEYPRTVWEEALVNAVVHRSYSIGHVPIEVRMFDDRLEIESPGGYPGPQRPAPDGTFPVSLRRNPRFAEALRYLGLVRLAKEGTRRMRQEMLRLDLPIPEYQEIQGLAVRVTLWNDHERRRSQRTDGTPWQEIAGLLNHDLAIYRQRAVQLWLRMVGGPPGGRRAPAPVDVVRAAERALGDSSIPTSEKATLIRLLENEPPSSTAAFAEELVRRLRLPTKLWFTESTIRDDVARLVARAESATEVVISILEQQRVPDADAQKFAFRVLISRLLLLEPLPPDSWTRRALAASRLYPADVTQGLASQITGE